MAGWLFSLPWIVGFICFTIGPILGTFALSFTEWHIGLAPKWRGFTNYVQLIADPLFYNALKLTTIYAVVSVPLTILVALVFAMLLNNPIRGIGIYRTIFYLPVMLPIASVAIIFRWVYNPDWGILNYFLSILHLPQPDWLASPRWALPALILMSLWNVGIGMVIFLAGLQSVPQQLLESAAVDGAGRMRRIWHVTLPSLAPIIFFEIMTNLIQAMQVFVQPYLMTQGGPGDSTRLFLLYIYQEAFQFSNFGYASTISSALFIYIALLTLITLRLSGFLTRMSN